MNILRLTTLISILLICSSSVWADDNLAQLSVSDAVSMALGVNVSLKAAEEGNKTSQSMLKIASYQTSLSLGSSASRNLVTRATTNTSEQNLEANEQNNSTTRNSTLTGQVYTGLDYENLLVTKASLEISPYGIGDTRGSIALTVSQPLLRGGGKLSEKAALLQQARSQLAIDDKELFQSRQNTVIAVIEAYYGTVLAREEVKVQESALAIAEEVADGTRKREKEGLVTGIEASRAEANVAQTRDTLNLKRQAARGSMDRLMLAIGKGIGQSPELTDRVPDIEMQIPPIEQAIETALKNRSELSVYDERLSEQKRKLAISKDALRPELNLVAGFGSEDANKGLISSSIFKADSTTVGVEVRLPFDKRISKANRDIAARDLAILNDQRTYKAEQIAEEVRRAYRSFESARTSLEIYGQNLSIAQKRLIDAQTLVAEGEASNREILDAQESLTRTESSLLSAKTDLYLAGINLKYAMGEDLTTMELK